MSDPSDDPYEEKAGEEAPKKEKGKKGPPKRQALLSARSQRKKQAQEEGGQDGAATATTPAAPANQVVSPQGGMDEGKSSSLPQLAPKAPQGAGGTPGPGPAPPQGQQHPQSQSQQARPSGMPPQRPPMMQPMMMGQRMPQGMMPRLPPQQQQMMRMRAQQMTMQQAAMRARAQMYGGGQMQMAQMAQMAYMQRMQLMQMNQMAQMQMMQRPQKAGTVGDDDDDEDEEEDEDEDEDDEEDDEEHDGDEDDDDEEEEEEEENMDEEEGGADAQAAAETGKPLMEVEKEAEELEPLQETPAEPAPEEPKEEKKPEPKKKKKEAKPPEEKPPEDKEDKPPEDKEDKPVGKPKGKKRKKRKLVTKHEIPPVRMRGLLRDAGEPLDSSAVPKPFGPPKEALPDIAGLKKAPQQPIPAVRGQGQPGQQFNSEDEDEDDDEDDSDDDDDDDDHPQVEGAYDPAEFENLAVSAEIKELFQYITRYTPQSIELDHKLKPFIPDFIPSVGDIDAFIKIPRPDNKPDTLGLTVLDEPCAKQSDPTVLDLQLRAISKQTTAKTLVVKSLESAEKNPKAIENWIESIRDLHRSKPPPNVHYSRNMPDIDTLMQEWPPEFEELLKEVSLPTADLDCDLGQFTDIVCSMLDIPVYKNSSHQNDKIQALHVLFTLYTEFKNSQHFQALAANNQLDNVLKDGQGDQLFL